MMPPPLSEFTAAERRIIRALRTPAAVQRFLNDLPYNDEPGGATLRSFRGVVRHNAAHCLEAALAAAVILEPHGYSPLVLSFESIDELDHVLFVYRTDTGWGSVARSRDPGLHGRKPVFTTPRTLALSYVDPYVDFTGQITGYAVVDLGVLEPYDWRLSDRNVWKVERVLLDWPHRDIHTSKRRIATLRARYRAYMKEHDNLKPVYYARRDRWSPIPGHFRKGKRQKAKGERQKAKGKREKAE
jgi:hypothetical protein